MSYFEVKNLEKIYIGGYHSISEVSFALNKSARLAILCGDGCGKTTILSVIAGLENVSSGEILLEGNDISKLAIKKRNFGFLSSDLQLNNYKKVKEIIAYPLKIRKIDNNLINKKVYEISKLLSIDKLLDCKIGKLTRFQKIVVGLARLGVCDRNLYLIDDIFDELDEEEGQKITDLIDKLFCDKTLIVATNNIKIAKQISGNNILIVGYGTSLGVCSIHNKEIFEKTIEGNKLLNERRVCCIPALLKNGFLIVDNKKYPHKKPLASDVFDKCVFVVQYDKIAFNCSKQLAISSKIEYINEENVAYFDMNFGVATIGLKDNKFKIGDDLNISFNIDDGVLYDFESEKRIST